MNRKENHIDQECISLGIFSKLFMAESNTYGSVIFFLGKMEILSRLQLPDCTDLHEQI